MWLLITIVGIIWLLCTTYLLIGIYYKLTRKEVFVPFIPADAKGIDIMCDVLKLTGTERVIDVGSGWGTILFYLVNKYPTMKLTGIELHPVLHLLAVIRRFLFHRISDMTLLKRDASTFNYENYDVIFLFMLAPFVNKILVPKFEKELKKGTKVVSYVFRMKSKAFTETKLVVPAHGWRSAIYLYEKID